MPYKIPSITNLQRAFQLFDAELLAREPDLNATRWPEHSGDPLSLNLEFLALYNVARRNALPNSFKNHLTRRGGNDAPILKPEDFKNAVGVSLDIFNGGKDEGGNLVHIHRLRQWADTTGLPYNRFIKVCIEFGLNGGSQWIPMPFAMLGSPKTRVALAYKLQEEIDNNLPELRRMFYARNPEAIGAKHLPSCFGVLAPGKFSDDIIAMRQKICGTCPFGISGACVKRAAGVMAKGPLQSRKDRQKKMAADRSRRYRRRKSKAEASISLQ